MAQKTITTTLPCVDAKVTTNENVVKQGKKYIGMFRVLNEDQVSFVEEPKVDTIHPELHWRLLNRTLHGRMSVNANHIKVEFYIRHGDYVSEQQLADMLASEMKEMATYSSILAWEISQTEEPGGLQSTGSHKSQT